MSLMAQEELDSNELTTAVCKPSTSFSSDFLNISREIEETLKQHCGPISICNTEDSLSISCNKEPSPVGNSLSDGIQEGSMRMPKECMVCGYATKHRHYGVSSCNACKAFFRRSLLLAMQYKCKFKGMCGQKSGIQRCRACRFDKCVLVGMNPRTMNLPDSANVREISDQVENRQHYLHQKLTKEYPAIIKQTVPVFEESIEGKLIKSLVYVELKVNRIRESSYRPHESTLFLNIRELVEYNKANILAQSDRYPKEQSWPLIRHSDVLELMQREAKAGHPHFLMFDIFLSIETAKTFPVFSQLDFKDQELLIKEVAFANTKLTEAFYSYQMKSDTVMMPNGVMPMKLAYPGLDDTAAQRHREFHAYTSSVVHPHHCGRIHQCPPYMHALMYS
ncbi:zinc finger, c4 type (two domains) domain-containing protein [Ditylenchus destructor]|uniref:Zinc finger, c4 type (Two domains) domain-containing protein n=1 Tax=Ditylenchus destructor TaxID=166010 RepID=A0AAD4N7W3_9BILA|nr:zinc finger, c4 type (two domains) domain-containing protein [Ditylenchus destructor]